MNNLIFIIVPISIIALNGPLIKSFLRKKDRSNQVYLRKDRCLNSKKDNCPMKSYKQCTNNVKPRFFCDCKRINYEICPHKNLDNINKIANNYLTVSNLHKINYPTHFPRVNIYNANKSAFDKLK